MSKEKYLSEKMEHVFNYGKAIDALINSISDKSQANIYVQSCQQLSEVILKEDNKKKIEDSIEKIINLVIMASISSNVKIRCVTMRMLRFCLLSQEIWEACLSRRLDFYIARSLDFSNSEKEIEQCIKIIIKIATSYPQLISDSIKSCIQAHCDDITKYHDKFDSTYIYLLCNMILEKPDLLREPYMKNTFYSLLTKISHKESLECLVDVLLYCIEYVSSSKPAYKKINYYRILSPMGVRLNMNCTVNLSTLTHVYTKMNELSEFSLNIALKLIFDSWTGILDFGMHPFGLKTALSQLPYEDITFQLQFITLLYDIIDFPFPIYKNSLMETLDSYVTYRTDQNINFISKNTYKLADIAMHDILSVYESKLYMSN